MDTQHHRLAVPLPEQQRSSHAQRKHVWFWHTCDCHDALPLAAAPCILHFLVAQSHQRASMLPCFRIMPPSACSSAFVTSLAGAWHRSRRERAQLLKVSAMVRWYTACISAGVGTLLFGPRFPRSTNRQSVSMATDPGMPEAAACGGRCAQQASPCDLVNTRGVSNLKDTTARRKSGWCHLTLMSVDLLHSSCG